MPKDEQEEGTKLSQKELATVVSIQEGKRENTHLDESSDPVLINVKDAWDLVKPGLEEILADTPHLTFRPEDVYTECVEERAFLFVSPKGWAVLTREIDQFTDDATLLIWLAYAFEKRDHVWIMYGDWLHKIANEAGCVYIEGRSAVKELEEYAIATGWTVDTRVYRLKVEDNGF